MVLYSMALPSILWNVHLFSCGYSHTIVSQENHTSSYLKSLPNTSTVVLISPLPFCFLARQPDSSEENEMVFCDGCNLAVHQYCYGINSIPEGKSLEPSCSYGELIGLSPSPSRINVHMCSFSCLTVQFINRFDSCSSLAK